MVWSSEKLDVLAITGGKPVQYTNGKPNFSPWSKGSFKFKEGELNGFNSNDFKSVYDKLKKLKDLKHNNNQLDG